MTRTVRTTIWCHITTSCSTSEISDKCVFKICD